MPSEICSLCHREIPDNSTVCPNCKNGSGTSLETITYTSDADRLVESDEGAYWELARHDEDYRTLFGDAKQILNFLPELGDIVNSVFPETAMVADISSSLQKQIDEGDLSFQVDRYGNDIAHLVDRNRRVRHVLRLDKRRLTPEMSQAWNNLRTRMMQAEIIRALCDIDRSIAEIRAGLQDDRLALVDVAWSLIEQARAASDVEYRKHLLRQALYKADKGRSQLNRSIGHDLEELAKQQDRGGVLLLVGDAMSIIQSQTSLTEKNADRAERIVCTVAAMESATRAIAMVHMFHSESDAAKTALLQFENMLRKQRLDNDAGITELSSFAREDQKPLFTRILSSHAKSFEVCGLEPKTHLMPSPSDASANQSSDGEDHAGTNVSLPTCGECGRDIEVGAALCAYHRDKKRESDAIKIAATLSAAKLAPKISKALSKAIRLIPL